MRTIAIYLVVLFLCGLAYRDWYKALCGFIVLMAVASHDSLPRSLFGIPGFNPLNLLLLNVLIGAALGKGGTLEWRAPPWLGKLLWLLLFILIVALIRYVFAYPDWTELYLRRGNQQRDGLDIFLEYGVNSFKWILPSLLLAGGASNEERFRWAIGALGLLYLALAILTIRWMPLGLIVDSDALQSRAARVLARELGYYRTNLSVMLAMASWIFFGATSLFPKYRVFFWGCAGACVLAMLLTGGRGGYLAWAFGGFVLAFLRWRRIFFFAPPVAAIFLALLPSVRDRILGVDSKADESAATELGAISAGRTEFWPLVIDKIYEAPIFGWGFWGSVHSGASERVIEHTGGGLLYHPHNAYLQIMIDTGVVGTIPVLMLYGVALRYSIRMLKRKSQPLYEAMGTIGVGAISGFLAACLTGQSFYAEERAVGLWCILMLVYTCYRRMELEDKATLAEKAPVGQRGLRTQT